MSIRARTSPAIARIALTTGALLCLAGASLSQAMQPPSTEPPPREGTPERAGRREGLFDPAALRARLERRLDEMKREEKRINDAMSRLDKGEAPEEIAKGLRPEGRSEGRSDPRAAGPRGDGRPKPTEGGKSAMPSRPVAETSAEDHERLMVQLRENLPRIADRMEAWRKADPESANRMLGRMAPRVREAAELRQHDPDMFTLKVAEFEAGFNVMDSARAITRARNEGDAAGREDRVKDAIAKLRTALGAQFDARVAVQAKEIEALEQRLTSLRSDHDRQITNRDRTIDEKTQRMSDPDSWPRRSHEGGDRRGPDAKKTEKQPG